ALQGLYDLGIVVRNDLALRYGDNIHRAEGGPEDGNGKHGNDRPGNGPPNRRRWGFLNLKHRGQKFPVLPFQKRGGSWLWAAHCLLSWPFRLPRPDRPDGRGAWSNIPGRRGAPHASHARQYAPVRSPEWHAPSARSTGDGR